MSSIQNREPTIEYRASRDEHPAPRPSDSPCCPAVAAGGSGIKGLSRQPVRRSLGGGGSPALRGTTADEGVAPRSNALPHQRFDASTCQRTLRASTSIYVPLRACFFPKPQSRPTHSAFPAPRPPVDCGLYVPDLGLSTFGLGLAVVGAWTVDCGLGTV
jgi:hypothetical protein